jgi:hypothetical protein
LADAVYGLDACAVGTQRFLKPELLQLAGGPFQAVVRQLKGGTHRWRRPEAFGAVARILIVFTMPE